MRDYTATDEAKVKRAARAALRKRQAKDPLADRERLVELWRGWAQTNRQHAPSSGAWWRPFITQPGFRWLLMPRLRAMLDGREKARRAQHAAEMRAYSQRWAQVKAERTAAKARASNPQLDLLDESAAC
jgi:hypothetical protein